jgi:hypothetical protein
VRDIPLRISRSFAAIHHKWLCGRNFHVAAGGDNFAATIPKNAAKASKKCGGRLQVRGNEKQKRGRSSEIRGGNFQKRGVSFQICGRRRRIRGEVSRAAAVVARSPAAAEMN